uniref:Uncharacterized protein n=1 Tax=Glossina brevipalpis TaxID=37001 RepID=A0A1A9X1C6_9MUSC
MPIDTNHIDSENSLQTNGEMYLLWEKTTCLINHQRAECHGADSGGFMQSNMIFIQSKIRWMGPKAPPYRLKQGVPKLLNDLLDSFLPSELTRDQKASENEAISTFIKVLNKIHVEYTRRGFWDSAVLYNSSSLQEMYLILNWGTLVPSKWSGPIVTDIIFKSLKAHLKRAPSLKGAALVKLSALKIKSEPFSGFSNITFMIKTLESLEITSDNWFENILKIYQRNRIVPDIIHICGRGMQTLRPPLLLCPKDFSRTCADKLDVLDAGDLTEQPLSGVPCINISATSMAKLASSSANGMTGVLLHCTLSNSRRAGTKTLHSISMTKLSIVINLLLRVKIKRDYANVLNKTLMINNCRFHQFSITAVALKNV